MDINETIKSQLQENPVILYMKGSPQAPQCGFSAKTVQALMACGERFAFVNILDNQELREGLKIYSSWPTYPQLYIDGELVGGCDIVLEMSESGELATMVKAAVQKAEA
ncbi:Grx4 family monothiol glutaredoxin [Marinobacter sp. X15-166B]|uniref:Grx4 family monothiol glutaredoxin n=1 Tax=Marinobacter sp. X15-166B TaxID=1897620 RepID=UPI00085C56AF|nr:Grx4 family monothiol glutaredoxin [Marinobacter sp. X15-166B]OEY66880.1 monothiol glutaredoxin, Grx4 family [Marinobacter sp. X15-166B]